MSTEKWYQNEINDLVGNVASLKSTDEVEEFFDNVLTSREINDIARRLAATRMLKDGVSYADIQDRLGLASTTIARLSNKVGFGFRRSSGTRISPKKVGLATTKKYNKPFRRYKGATPIHKII
jgi:TrpR-related protein YerC/YecD